MDHAPATRRIGPVDPAKRKAIEASKAATRAARAERGIAKAIGGRSSRRPGAGLAADGLLDDTSRVMFPDGAYDDFTALRRRLDTIKYLEDHGVRGSALVAAMAIYNAVQEGDARAIHEWPNLVTRLAAAERDACPPPPKGYWDRRPAALHSAMDDGW